MSWELRFGGVGAANVRGRINKVFRSLRTCAAHEADMPLVLKVVENVCEASAGPWDNPGAMGTRSRVERRLEHYR
jgi:hypothetical protein